MPALDEVLEDAPTRLHCLFDHLSGTHCASTRSRRRRRARPSLFEQVVHAAHSAMRASLSEATASPSATSAAARRSGGGDDVARRIVGHLQHLGSSRCTDGGGKRRIVPLYGSLAAHLPVDLRHAAPPRRGATRGPGPRPLAGSVGTASASRPRRTVGKWREPMSVGSRARPLMTARPDSSGTPKD